MKQVFTLTVVIGILMSGMDSAGAQSTIPATQGQQRKSGSYTLYVDAEEVVLNGTVLDGKGRLVNDLTKSNFRVFEDKALQSIISVGLIVDNSGSMNSKRAAVSTAALDLVKASNPQDETFVINFTDQAYLDQDFTSDLDRLQKGLSQLSLTGGTALYDTVATAADKMERSAARPRKVLIVITDGDDNASKLTLDNAIHSVQDMHGPIIYSIGLLFGGDKSRHAKRDLEALSRETGGIAFFPTSLLEGYRFSGNRSGPRHSQPIRYRLPFRTSSCRRLPHR
jgi:Ca-activated chloride channel family protein